MKNKDNKEFNSARSEIMKRSSRNTRIKRSEIRDRDDKRISRYGFSEWLLRREKKD